MESVWLCRKVGFWRPNPKIGYQKIKDLRVSTFLFSVICDRATFHASSHLRGSGQCGTITWPGSQDKSHATHGGHTRHKRKRVCPFVSSLPLTRSPARAP